jgi:hypothetical protein
LTVQTGNISLTQIHSGTQLIRTFDSVSMANRGVQITRKGPQTFHNVSGADYTVDNLGRTVIGNRSQSAFSTPASRRDTTLNEAILIDDLYNYRPPTGEGIKNRRLIVVAAGSNSMFGNEINTVNGHDKLIKELGISVVKGFFGFNTRSKYEVKDMKSLLTNQGGRAQLLVAQEGTFKLITGTAGNIVAYFADLRIDGALVAGGRFELSVVKNAIPTCNRHGIEIISV